MGAHAGVEAEGGGGAERWARSFYLTPWDDVKSPTSRPPPTPSSLPYAEELALCGGLGSWLSAHTCTRCPPTHPSTPSLPSRPPFLQNGEQQIFLFGGTTQDCARAPKWTTSLVDGDSSCCLLKQHSREGKQFRVHREMTRKRFESN